MTERPQPERMSDFFDARSEGYEKHMERTVTSFSGFYEAIASPFPETEDALNILDIGCGTGLELDVILSRAPNAIVTGIDVSAGMLNRLREKHVDRADRLRLVQGSYLEIPLGEGAYDYAVSVMTLHHLLPPNKRDLYCRIRRALKREGAYVEGDWVVSPEEERRHLAEYEEQMRAIGASEGGSYHIDVPLSLETQTRLLKAAGFSTVDVIWQADGNSVYVARG